MLLLSSSRVGKTGFLEKAIPVIRQFLGDSPLRIAFIPFASVDNNYDEYALKLKDALKDLSYEIKTAKPDGAKKIIEESDAIMVGGGNTFKLLHDIYQLNLRDVIRDKVSLGAPYIGWSAGANILCPTIATTNDMPVIEPKSFNALGLVPFQINPHYTHQKIENFNGETRDQRLEEFVKMNLGIPVVALPEGSGLLFEKDHLTFFGECSGVLFFEKNNGKQLIQKELISIGADLSYLL